MPTYAWADPSFVGPERYDRSMRFDILGAVSKRDLSWALLSVGAGQDNFVRFGPLRSYAATRAGLGAGDKGTATSTGWEWQDGVTTIASGSLAGAVGGGEDTDSKTARTLLTPLSDVHFDITAVATASARHSGHISLMAANVVRRFTFGIPVRVLGFQMVGIATDAHTGTNKTRLELNRKPGGGAKTLIKALEETAAGAATEFFQQDDALGVDCAADDEITVDLEEVGPGLEVLAFRVLCRAAGLSTRTVTKAAHPISDDHLNNSKRRVLVGEVIAMPTQAIYFGPTPALANDYLRAKPDRPFFITAMSGGTGANGITVSLEKNDANTDINQVINTTPDFDFASVLFESTDILSVDLDAVDVGAARGSCVFWALPARKLQAYRFPFPVRIHGFEKTVDAHANGGAGVTDLVLKDGTTVIKRLNSLAGDERDDALSYDAAADADLNIELDGVTSGAHLVGWRVIYSPAVEDA